MNKHVHLVIERIVDEIDCCEEIRSKHGLLSAHQAVVTVYVIKHVDSFLELAFTFLLVCHYGQHGSYFAAGKLSCCQGSYSAKVEITLGCCLGISFL
jgi:hypothetical protein